MVRTMSTTELKGGGNCIERQEDYFQTKNLLWGEILPIFVYHSKWILLDSDEEPIKRVTLS